MISDGEVPSDVVPTVRCHSLTILTSLLRTPLSIYCRTVRSPAARSCSPESVCNTEDQKSQHRAHSLSQQQRGVLTTGTVLASAALSLVAVSPAQISRFDLPGSRSQLAEDSSSLGLQATGDGHHNLNCAKRKQAKLKLKLCKN